MRRWRSLARIRLCASGRTVIDGYATRRRPACTTRFIAFPTKMQMPRRFDRARPKESWTNPISIGDVRFAV